MVLWGVVGVRKAVNEALMRYALTHTPCIIVDCANIANIHKWFPLFPQTDYASVYVHELELLYKLRDALITVEQDAQRLNAQTIVVTSMRHLFSYQNAAENAEVYAHAWELLATLGKEFDVRVAVDNATQRRLAHVYGAQEELVGHTVWSQRQNLEAMIAELDGYARALRPDERELCKDVLRVPMRHVGAVASANSLHAWSFLLLTITLEQEKRLRRLEEHAGVAYRRVASERQDRLVAASRH